jgi:hypothetical protein
MRHPHGQAAVGFGEFCRDWRSSTQQQAEHNDGLDASRRFFDFRLHLVIPQSTGRAYGPPLLCKGGRLTVLEGWEGAI